MSKYEVSVVIPYYKRLEEFRYALTYNHEQFSQVREVILVIDEPIANVAIFAFLKQYPINFVFLMNSEKHPWRNPAVVINKGLQAATSAKCIIMSPESILLPNAIRLLVEGCTDDTYALGEVRFMTYDTFENNRLPYMNTLLINAGPDKNVIGPINFGSICCTKANFSKANYYDEVYSLCGWGKDDDGIRSKLAAVGVRKVLVKASLVHAEGPKEFQDRRKQSSPLYKKETVECLYNDIRPVTVSGMDTADLIQRASEVPGVKHLVVTDNLCAKYPIILLAPAYNEQKNMVEYLNTAGEFVDGIIMLDDGSSDYTWDLIDHPKLIMKCKKKRTTFNDLQNRTMLLKLLEAVAGAGVEIGWFLWLDLDERLTTNNTFLTRIKRQLLEETTADNISLPLFHMWDDKKYNAEYPYSEKGLQYKLRLIRHKPAEMPYSLRTNQMLHFSLNPYKGNKANSILQIKHLSYNTPEGRENKYELYTTKYDINGIQKNYDHIINENAKLSVYDEFMMAAAAEALSSQADQVETFVAQSLPLLP